MEPYANDAGDTAVQEIGTICRTCIEEVDVDGGGVSLMTSQGYAGTMWASDDIALRVEELQFVLGEGPCVDAVALGAPVIEPDLSTRGAARRRWPAFAPEAAAAGVRAIFGLPLSVGETTLGALDLYRRTPGPLTARQLDQVQEVAVATSNVLLRLEATEGRVGRESHASAYHWSVHQAAGMISQQLGVSVDESLVKLRAVAFSEARPIDELAADVVARRRRFTEEDR